MVRNHILSYIFGILTCFLTGIVAHEALIGGKSAEINQFPYQVSLQSHGYGHVCGGGIIDDQFVLTAAHCIVRDDGDIDLWPYTILAGTNKLYKISPHLVIIPVKKIFVPAHFIRNVYDSGDIAVLMLNHTLDLRHHRNLKKLNLPSSNYETFVDKTAEIAGFGWNWISIDENGKESGGNVRGLLRYATTRVILEGHQNVIKYVFGSVASQTYISARIELSILHPHGVCMGDSGGPLVKDGKTVIGILSTTPFGCLETIRSSIYTRVAHYLDFIHNAMQDKEHEDIRTLQLIS